MKTNERVRKNAPHGVLTARLFLGILCSSEIKMHLNRSYAWKSAQGDSKLDSDELVAVNYQDHDYIGCYCLADSILMKELKQYEKKILERLRHYCPMLDLKSQSVCVFTQLFIH